MTFFVFLAFILINAWLEHYGQQVETVMKAELQSGGAEQQLARGMRDRKLIKFAANVLCVAFISYAVLISHDHARDQLFYVLLAFAFAVYLATIGWDGWTAAEMCKALYTNTMINARRAMLLIAGGRLLTVLFFTLYMFRYTRMGIGDH